MLREVTRVHITRLRGSKEAEETGEESREEGNEEGGESEMTCKRIVVRRNDNEEEPKRERVEERIPKMKTGERYEIRNKGEGQQRELR